MGKFLLIVAGIAGVGTGLYFLLRKQGVTAGDNTSTAIPMPGGYNPAYPPTTEELYREYNELKDAGVQSSLILTPEQHQQIDNYLTQSYAQATPAYALPNLKFSLGKLL